MIFDMQFSFDFYKRIWGKYTTLFTVNFPESLIKTCFWCLKNFVFIINNIRSIALWYFINSFGYKHYIW